jgi:AmmeMemoRadiSam system protein A/AmmeMemoRadiSam system protein B
MDHTSSLVFAGIAPHPPIMVPEVGREAIAEVRSSIDGMAELTERLINSQAETVIIISPHAPLEPNAFIAYDGPKIYGDFANFRAPTATIHAEVDTELLEEITRTAAQENLVVSKIRGFDLDHGTAVPLYFLQRNGWHGRVIALGYTFLTNEQHVSFGKCIEQAIEKVGRRVAFIASGDLSHRLKLDAPAGYSPNAHQFDEAVVQAIRDNSTKRIAEIDPDLRRIAGECGYRSMLVAIGVTSGSSLNCEVISYEAPFGVGYLVAQLVSRSEGTADIDESEPEAKLRAAITALARQAVETFVSSHKIIDPPADLPDSFKARAGCFVSIKTRNGDLRGCIGTIEPVKNSLAAELIANAVSSATHDPRFGPVRPEELPNLKYSVDVLSAPESCTLEDLDPQIYGVIVEDQDGSRRGLLLPHLEGVNAVERQVEIASRKAGIEPGSPVRLARFRADRYSE